MICAGEVRNGCLLYTSIHPAIVTKKNVDHFRELLKALGFSFDWDREINTTDPEYYKWTQWIFLWFNKGRSKAISNRNQKL